MENYLSIFTEYDIPGAFWVNIQLTFWAAIGALVLGTILALLRISPVASFQAIGTSYVNLVRNTPLTIIILFAVLALYGQLGFTLGGDFQANFFRLSVLGLPLGNTLIALIKNSTVAAVGSVATESSSVMKTMIEFRSDIVIPIFLTFAIGFVIIVIPVGLLTTWASKKLAVAR